YAIVAIAYIYDMAITSSHSYLFRRQNGKCLAKTGDVLPVWGTPVSLWLVWRWLASLQN
ncbi:MAG: hypothetical protein RL764_1947, partial [Pseudomonadota bacterium]